MEKFETYVSEAKAFLEEWEKFQARSTKAAVTRLRRHMDNMARIKVDAKKEIKDSVS